QGRLQAKLIGGSLLPALISIGPASLHAQLNGLQFRLALRAVDASRPVRRVLDRPALRRHKPLWRFGRPRSQAAPWPRLTAIDQIRPQRIPLHVPADSQKMLVLLDRKTFKSPLVQRPC